MRKVILFYVLLLVLHALHLVEETLGNAYFINDFYNDLNNFLVVNIILLLIPTILLYFVSKDNKIALYLAFLYPIVMIIDGIDHIMEFFVRGYVGGAAGLITGVVFLPISILLILQLRRALSFIM